MQNAKMLREPAWIPAVCRENFWKLKEAVIFLNGRKRTGPIIAQLTWRTSLGAGDGHPHQAQGSFQSSGGWTCP